MSAQQILQDYIDGARRPVLGPLTYVETLGLVSINEQLLSALKALVAVPVCSGPATLLAKIAAHRNAHAAIKLASGVSPDVIEHPALVHGICNAHEIHLAAAKHIDAKESLA